MSQIPSKDQILQWIADNPTQATKRDITRAFDIKGADRIDLKRVLKEMEADGQLTRRTRSVRDHDRLPPVSVLHVLPPDRHGDLWAEPLEWTGDGPAPRVLLIPQEGEPALGAGDRILGRLTETPGGAQDYTARLIRRIGTNPRRVLGLFRKTAEGGRILPIDKGRTKGDSIEWQVPPGATGGAKEGELVEAEQSGPPVRFGLPRARVIARLGDPTAARAVSLIAIRQHGIPDDFPDAVIAEADAMTPATLEGRDDLTDLPLVTIDPSDARDHDDAVWAHADDDPRNPGGHVIWVAIADVAHYVRPGSALDHEARKRGNSSYFPDRVVPMLPDRLSGDLCSLHEGVPRPCIAVRMQINAGGHKIAHKFQRGLMRSVASLTYEQVQAAQDGTPDDRCAPLMADVIAPLYAAFAALMAARTDRQPLDLDLPERKVALSEAGEVVSVAFRDRLDAHRLIEECMILANVAAAETLVARKTDLLFRVHEEPTPEKLDSLRDTAEAAGLVLAKGQVLKTAHLNRLLAAARDTDVDELINMSTLRAMTQAYYSPQNFGHFGLALQAYAHFTSPIRRYSDLIVHRALISAHRWGGDGLSPEDVADMDATAAHISDTERRSMLAERDTTDRYLAAFLADRVGQEFAGRISGISRAGVFVKLDETGADGLVPMRALGGEFFHYERDSQSLIGADTGRVIGLGARVTVKLAEATPATGGLLMELLTLDGEAPPRGAQRRPGKPVKRRLGAARASSRGSQKISRKR